MFRSDGQGTWDAIVWTLGTYSGDVWHSSFAIRDADNILLFRLGEFHSPTTHGEKVYMHADFTFPVEKFSSISTTTNYSIQYSRC